MKRNIILFFVGFLVASVLHAPLSFSHLQTAFIFCKSSDNKSNHNASSEVVSREVTVDAASNNELLRSIDSKVDLFNRWCKHQWLQSGTRRQLISLQIPASDDVGIVLRIDDDKGAEVRDVPRMLMTLRQHYPQSPVVVELNEAIFASSNLSSQQQLLDSYFRTYNVIHVQRVRYEVNESQQQLHLQIDNHRPLRRQQSCYSTLFRIYGYLLTHLRKTQWIGMFDMNTRALRDMDKVHMADINTHRNHNGSVWSRRFTDYLALIEPEHNLSAVQQQRRTIGYGSAGGGVVFRRQSFLCAFASPTFHIRLEFAFGFDPRIEFSQEACLEAAFLIEGYDVSTGEDK